MSHYGVDELSTVPQGGYHAGEVLLCKVAITLSKGLLSNAPKAAKLCCVILLSKCLYYTECKKGFKIIRAMLGFKEVLLIKTQ
jgi:hypothetical protein